jgi:hypothetical protein
LAPNLRCKKSCKRAVCEPASSEVKDHPRPAHARHRATPSGEVAILRAMRDGRHLAALLVVLGALALAVPALALAGGSAGNNQYTNPFGGGTTSQLATTPPRTSSTTAPVTTTSTPPPVSTESPGTTESPPTATPTTSVVTTSEPAPTATAAASPGAGTTTDGKALPRTGYAGWEIAGFALVMIAGGFVIRRRVGRT